MFWSSTIQDNLLLIHMYKIIFAFFLYLIAVSNSFSQEKFTISGTVSDAKNNANAD